MFGFGEEEEYEQAPKRSIFSSIGDFLLKAATILAIIALAVVTAVTVSDTARDILNDMTKDKKTGQGGLGDSIRSSMGLAKEKATGAVAAVKNYVKETFPSFSNTVGNAKDQAVSAVDTAENTLKTAAAVGLGAVALKKIKNAVNVDTPGTVKNGEFQPLAGKEKKAAEALQKLEKQQETLKAQREELLKKSTEARTELKKATEAKEIAQAESNKFKSFKDKFSKGSVKAGLALKSTAEAETKAENALIKLQKELKQLRKDIQTNIKAVAEAKKLVPEGVTTRGEFNQSKANVAGTTAKPEPTTKAETNTKAGAQPHSSATSSKETVIRPEKVTLLDKDGKTIIAEINQPQNGFSTVRSTASNIADKAKSMLGNILRSPKLVRAGVAGAILQGGSEALASFDKGEYGTAAIQGTSTAGKLGLLTVTAPVAYGTSEIIDNVAHTADTLLTGKPSTLSKGMFANIIDAGIKEALNTNAAQHAYLDQEGYKILKNLPKDQQDIIRGLQEQAKENGVNIPLATLIEHAGNGHYLPKPNTPAVVIDGKEQQLPSKSN